LLSVFSSLSFSYHGHPLHLHPFPTRRSSDLCCSTCSVVRCRSATSRRIRRTSRTSAGASTNTFTASSERSDSHQNANSPSTITRDRKSTRLNSSHVSISYAVFCLKKKNTRKQ